MKTRKCKQCGELKPIEQYREYYGNRKGRYTLCKDCERVNSREKYLSQKRDAETISEAEQEELLKIYRLWDYQVAIGLRPPRAGRKRRQQINLDEMISKYEQQAEQVTQFEESLGTSAAPPAPELFEWLNKPLSRDPEYYQDEVYERLRETYRPQLRINPNTMLPVYDNTYKAILDQIASRFDEYEDAYYKEEHDGHAS